MVPKAVQVLGRLAVVFWQTPRNAQLIIKAISEFSYLWMVRPNMDIQQLGIPSIYWVKVSHYALQTVTLHQ